MIEENLSQNIEAYVNRISNLKINNTRKLELRRSTKTIVSIFIDTQKYQKNPYVAYHCQQIKHFDND